MTQQNRFLFGGSFVPLALETHVPMSQWEDGMRQMHDLGFTAYRAFVAWNRIEGREGIRDFRELDYSLELAARYDLSVTLNVGGIFGNLQGFRPPPWLQYGCHCQHRMPHPDSPSSPNTPDLLLCNDDPVYREKALAFMRDVVARYARHPALECWAVWNEPAGNPCYCPHTLRLFRNWLQSRYASLDQLNAAWGTLFPLGFPAWDDVRPAAMEDSHVSKAQRIDWLTFCERHMEEQVNEVDRLVKEVDPAHPTSLNLQGVHARDFTRFRMSQIGISAYLEHDRYDARGVYQWVNVYMHSARAGHRPEEKIRIIETDSGPRALSERHPGDPAAAEARDWAFIAQGAGMILAWIYRTRISGGHACQSSLTAWDGSATERLRRAGRRAQVLRAHGARILQAHPFPGQVGVLHDKKLWRLSHVEGFHHPDRNYCMTDGAARRGVCGGIPDGFPGAGWNDRALSGRADALLPVCQPGIGRRAARVCPPGRNADCRDAAGDQGRPGPAVLAGHARRRARGGVRVPGGGPRGFRRDGCPSAQRRDRA